MGGARSAFWFKPDGVFEVNSSPQLYLVFRRSGGGAHARKLFYANAKVGRQGDPFMVLMVVASRTWSRGVARRSTIKVSVLLKTRVRLLGGKVERLWAGWEINAGQPALRRSS